MFKIIASMLLVSVLASPAFAEESPVLPVLNEGFKPEIGVAGLVGLQQFEKESGFVYGLELSLNCLLLKPMRTQISLTQYRAENDKYSVVSAELSPHFTIEAIPSLYVGIGPVLGASFLVTKDETFSVFNYGAGASLRYVTGSGFFVGADARYVFTTDIEASIGPFALNLGDIDNARYLGKIGYKF